MVSSSKYKVVVSDRAKRMLGTHLRFMAQVNKEAAAAKKKEIDCRKDYSWLITG